MHETPSTNVPRRSAQTLRPVFDAAWDASQAADGREDITAVFFELADWRPWLDTAAGLLDDAERGRVGRKQRPGDRDELALTYALHRLVLGRALRTEPGLVPLRRDAAGRPCLPDDELHTSLSHADGVVAVVVSRHGAVGVDIERATRAADMNAIAERVWDPNEACSLIGLPQTQQAAALLELWVRKEALLKAAGIGLALEMNSFPAPADQEVTLPAASGARAIIRMLDIGPAYVAAIAVASVPMPAIRSCWLQPEDPD